MIPTAHLPAFKHTLVRGAYNLLLGSGVSLDSTNGEGRMLPSATALKDSLCKLKSVSETTSLQRVSSLLTTDAERKQYLISPYLDCKPAASVRGLPRFLWRRLFTFNIDDVLENLYKAEQNAKQTLVPVNFDDVFEPTPSHAELLAIHLHGWVQKPGSGFVFSHTEYARHMRGQNPWLHLLAQILPTEPFIIAGTSLNESDLEYYLSFRNDSTPRRGRGPSVLVDPNPDALTAAECKKYGLVLVKAAFGDFLSWLEREVPSPPSLSELIVPNTESLFAGQIPPKSLLRFFTDFRLVSGGESPRSSLPSPFLSGKEPQWEDLRQHLDISRADNQVVLTEVEDMLSKNTSDPKIIVILDDAGVGKTTLMRRVAHELASKGRPVFALQTLARIDSKAAIECLSRASTKVTLIVDSMADHAEQVMEILREPDVALKVVVLSAERFYREQLIQLVSGGGIFRSRTLQPLSHSERLQFIELYRQYGLVGDPKAVKEPSQYASLISGDPIAVAACRILNDFKPLQTIVNSLWDAATEPQQFAYVCVALAEHCHPPGLHYGALRSIVGQQMPLDDMLTTRVSLSLAENEDDVDYLLPLNAVIGERMLANASAKPTDLLLRVFLAVAKAIAPRVNRKAIMARTPEARLAGRLFDADRIVKPLLGKYAEELFTAAQKDWEWNSRFWGQRALLVADSDVEVALKYARHGTAIERHPFTVTTLGTILLLQSERSPSKRVAAFNEAFDLFIWAIETERQRSRARVHPYYSLLGGVARYIGGGGKLAPAQVAALRAHVGEAQYRFGHDTMLQSVVERIQCIL